MSIQALKRKPLLFIYTAGIVLLLIAGWLWWNSTSTKTDRVWWGMINQSLATNGVTVQASQDNSGTTVNQTIQFSMGGQNMSHSLTTLTQTGTTVQDEMIATPTVDYTRYVSVKTDQKTAKGKALDFSKVTGVWAKRDGQAQLFSQDVLGTGLPLGGVAVPIANLTPSVRTKLVDQIRTQGVYDISFKDKDVKKEHQNGRLVYIYTAKIQPVLYASMMKSLAKSVGIHDLDSLDPNSFSTQQPFQMKLTVDAHARQLLSAEAIGADIKQTYSSYDVPVEVSIPKNTITSTELQKRLTELQQ
jgi:hypothetical protein